MIKTFVYISRSPAATHQLGMTIGKQLQGDETVAMTGELGAGKTHLIQGIARGAGVTAPVTSPTFVLQRIYKGSGFDLNHFDAYRIDVREFVGLGVDEWLGKMVNIIEWGERVGEVLPADSIWIKIKSLDDSTREIKISYPEERAYLIPE